MEIHVWAWIISGTFTVLATVISLFLMYKHWRNYTNPPLQRCIVRIILMVPIYAIDSWLSLRFKDIGLLFNLLRDCYEAYVIYIFFTYLVTYLHGTSNLIELLEGKPPMKHPFPTCCFPPFTPGNNFLQWCKICILQFTLFKPLLTFVALLLSYYDVYTEGELEPSNAYLYLTIFDNISITVSMYFLVLFYMATKEELAPIKPVPKFISIKAIIFFSFWQGVVLAIIQKLNWLPKKNEWTPDDISMGTQDFLITGEMLILSILHIYVFDYKPYRNLEKAPFIKAIFKQGKVRETLLPLISNMTDTVNPAHDIKLTREALQPLVSPDIWKLENGFNSTAQRRVRVPLNEEDFEDMIVDEDDIAELQETPTTLVFVSDVNK